MQYTYQLQDGSYYQYTAENWLTPNGNWIHKKGIEPTIAIKQPDYFSAGPLQLKEPLKVDMNNEDVKHAQVLLKGLSFDPGREDGYFSKDMKKAVMAFQDQNKLNKTGVIDTRTAETLNRQIEKKKSDEKNDLQLQTALKSLFVN